MKQPPIYKWLRLIQAGLPEEESLRAMEALYAEAAPEIAEIILNSYCPNRCRHCIYPPDYHQLNPILPKEQWLEALATLYVSAGIRQFIFCGRSWDVSFLNLVRDFKSAYPDITFGIIVDGINLTSTVESILSLEPDWVDISIDGLEEAHDSQRNQRGAFHQTVNILEKLLAADKLSKINLLTCLTTLNIHSVPSMIRFFNEMGFKNFFMTPIGIVNGVRPDPRLKPKADDFIRLTEILRQEAISLSDTWLEINVFEAEDFLTLLKGPSFFKEPLFEACQMEHVENHGDNELHLVYHPNSLSGLAQIVVNSDGTIIPPKVVAWGRLTEAHIFGHTLDLKSNPGLLKEVALKPAFSFFTNEFKKEQAMLQDCIKQNVFNLE